MEEKEGKYLFGVVKVGEKGQIVIPNDARKLFDIKPGDSLVVLGDKTQGIGIVKTEIFESFAKGVLNNINGGK